eukprot:Colp12_sorted_trinity150504_noHs@10454
MEFLRSLVSAITDGVIIFGGVLPYVPQYQQIKNTGSSEGFSTLVCFVLLASNIMRVFFWFARHFETALLWQSLVMIVTQLVMLKLCLTVKGSRDLGSSSQRTRSFFDLRARDFWQWTQFADYLAFLALMTLTLAVFGRMFDSYPSYVETLGYASTLTEATLGMPQLYANHKNRSTVGVSMGMVGGWLVGDSFKTIYFLAKGAPTQFLVCGIVQLVVDFLIINQMFTDKDSAFHQRVSQHTHSHLGGHSHGHHGHSHH